MMANAFTGFGSLRKKSLIKGEDAFAVAPVDSCLRPSASALIMERGRLS